MYLVLLQDLIPNLYPLGLSPNPNMQKRMGYVADSEGPHFKSLRVAQEFSRVGGK